MSLSNPSGHCQAGLKITKMIRPDRSTFELALECYQAGNLEEARRHCVALSDSGKATARSCCLLSVIANALGDYDAALQSANASLKLSPEYQAAWLNKASALINLGRARDALTPLDNLLSLNPVNYQGIVMRGLACLYSGDFDSAISSYENARSMNPGDTETLVRLADAYEHVHRLEEATNILATVLERQPGHAEASVIAARIERRNKDYQSAWERLGNIETSGLNNHDREAVYSEMGLVADRLGQYAQAFGAFASSNRAAEARNAGKYDYRTYVKRIHNYKDAFNAGTIAGWTDFSPTDQDRPAPIFLVGFPRSGTTLTEQILSAHSRIYTSNELPVISNLAFSMEKLCPGKGRQFPFDLGDLSDADIRILREEYWRRVAKSGATGAADQRYLDKLPLNITATGFIRRIFPDAKIIFACRDPRDVCLSCFFQRFNSNKAMAAFFRLETTARLYAEVMDLWFHYRDVLDCDIYESRYEELTVDFETNARALISFSGESWEDSVLGFYEKDRYRDVLTPSYQDISTPVYTRSVGRWKHYARELEPVMGVLEPFVRKLGYAV